uniref:Uncharacterized protein n=1 Tax=Anguilla anguilla TaxID=7936 RepID=A0A0E9VMF8_ANGAN
MSWCQRFVNNTLPQIPLWLRQTSVTCNHCFLYQ